MCECLLLLLSAVCCCDDKNSCEKRKPKKHKCPCQKEREEDFCPKKVCDCGFDLNYCCMPSRLYMLNGIRGGCKEPRRFGGNYFNENYGGDDDDF